MGWGKENLRSTHFKNAHFHSLLLFQNETQQYEQNLTNWSYAYGYFPITRA